MMMLGFAGWFFLVIASVMIGLGLFTMFGGVVRHFKMEDCPYTPESMLAAARWVGLSVTTFGLGLAGFVLLNKVLFTIGAFACTVGLLTFLVMIALARVVGAKAAAELVRKDADTVISMDAFRSEREDHDDHHDNDPGDWLDGSGDMAA